MIKTRAEKIMDIYYAAVDETVAMWLANMEEK